MKFEEAFYLKKNLNIPIYVLTDIFVNHPKLFEMNYRRFLYCPECQQAQLAYNNAKSPYLSAYPNSVHDNDCDLAQNVATHEESRRIVYNYNCNPETRENIARQMDSTLRLLLAEKSISYVNQNSPLQHRDCTEQQDNNHNAQQVKPPRLPRKRIDLPLKDSDYNTFKIFYGNVILRWKKVEKTGVHSGFYKMLLYTQKENEFKCSIKITETVYSHLPTEYKSISNTLCKIVFIAQLEKSQTELYSDNCGFTTLINSQLLKITS